MADSRLTKQQQRRLDAAQGARSAPWLDDAADPGAAAGRIGVVVSHLRREVEVEPTDAVGTRLRCFMRATVDGVVTGDQVVIEPDPEEARRSVIVARLPRRSLLARHTPRGVRPVCANLDLLLVTIAPEPAPHADLVDRYLLAAGLDDLPTAVVVNKADRLGDSGHPELTTLLDLYRGLGYEVLEASARTGDGLAPLAELLAGRTSAFVGQSGVGKSSLINALIPEAEAEVGTLSERRNRGRGRGRHTTSATRLYRLPHPARPPGLVIDSPGIREFVADVPDHAALASGFPEIAAAARACRFRNCSHLAEPDCGVLAAVEGGHVAPSRLASFRLLREELERRLEARPGSA